MIGNKPNLAVSISKHPQVLRIQNCTNSGTATAQKTNQFWNVNKVLYMNDKIEIQNLFHTHNINKGGQGKTKRQMMTRALLSIMH